MGDYLRQVVERGGQAVALLVWGTACHALKDRDQWIGWSATTRVERLSLIVQNRRFLLLTPKGAEPNLASQVLGLVLRELDGHWRAELGYTPLLAETCARSAGRNTRFRIAAVLTLVVMALMAGRREIAEIVRFATTFSQAQRRELCLPRKAGTKAFWSVPGYSVFIRSLPGSIRPALPKHSVVGWPPRPAIYPWP